MRMLLGVVAWLLLAGCSGLPVLDPAAPADPKVGYVYGMFRLPETGRRCDLRVGLALKQAGTSKEYVLEFQRTDLLTVVPIEPGKYTATQVVFMTCESMESGRRPFASNLLQGEIEIRPQTALYLGHYEAETNTSSRGNVITQRWNVTRGCWDYGADTARLAKGWPKLAAVQRIDATTGRRLC